MEFQDRVYVFVAAVLLLLTPFVAAESQLNANAGAHSSGVGDDSAAVPTPQQHSSAVGDDSAVRLQQPSSGDDSAFDDDDDDDDDTDGRRRGESSLPPLPVTLSFASPPLPSSPSSDAAERDSVYEFAAKDSDGNNVSLSKYKGRVLLIVNYAHFCGLQRHNVKHLSKMAKQYGPRGLTILMFPSNTFMQNIGGDMPGKSLKASHPEFEVFSPIYVNSFFTIHEHPLYTFLKRTTPGINRFIPKIIRWNFTKFLVDRNGHTVARYDPLTTFPVINKGVQKLLNSASADAEINAEVTIPSQPIE